MPFDRDVKNRVAGSNPGSLVARTGQALTAIRYSESRRTFAVPLAETTGWLQLFLV